MMRLTSRTLGVTVGSAALVLSCLGIAQASGGPSGPKPGTHNAVVVPASVRRLAATSTDLNETVFTPITPCRIVDTRAAGGRIGAAGRSFYVAGTANFPAQGGTSGGCGIPASATAVSADLVALGGTAPGYMRAYPADAAAPPASVLNYQKASSIANAVPLSILPGTAEAVTVTASTSAYLVIDITGYYQQPIAAYIEGSGDIYSGTRRVLSVAHTAGSGHYVMTVDRNADSCAASAVTSGPGEYASTYTDGSRVDVKTWSLGTNAQAVTTDYNFNLSVTC